ncbi:hypothetical protein H4R22_002183 [Coemansia sp. RSA 1290]|nr:hypothetical protein H4R22_002183 [Coemansia sp. RSA 1290]
MGELLWKAAGARRRQRYKRAECRSAAAPAQGVRGDRFPPGGPCDSPSSRTPAPPPITRSVAACAPRGSPRIRAAARRCLRRRLLVLGSAGHAPRQHFHLSRRPMRSARAVSAMHARSRAALLLLLPLLAAVALGAACRPPVAALAAAPRWAAKHGLLNTHGAKVAWAWTSALFAAALLAAPRPPASLARYAAATLYWLALTRWLLGPPLLDRIFVLSGGRCHAGQPLAAASLRECRAAGGSWAGGHDVSGHCFLLIHSALFLAEEAVVPLLAAARRAPPALAAARRAVLAAVLAVICAWVAILYATARYYHGAAELLSGTAAGVAFWLAFYCSGLAGV